MSLKRKLATLATEKLAESVGVKEKVDNAINATLNKIGKTMGEKTAEEYIAQLEGDYLIIRKQSFSVGTMAGALVGGLWNVEVNEATYQVVSNLGEIKYSSRDRSTLTERDIFDIYSVNGEKIGYVKEYLIPVGVPLLEKDVKKCSVYLGNQKIAELKKYKLLGEREFDVISDSVKIKRNDNKEYTILCGRKKVATLYRVPLNLKDGYVDRYIMKITETKKEDIAILLAVGVDLLNV